MPTFHSYPVWGARGGSHYGGSGEGDGGGWRHHGRPHHPYGDDDQIKSHEIHSGGNNHRGEDHGRYDNNHRIGSFSNNSSYLDVQLGSHLHTVYPEPIRSDQVIVVPSMFGNSPNVTVYEELCDDLERLMRDKYGNKTWSMNGVLRHRVISSRVYGVAGVLSLPNHRGGGVVVDAGTAHDDDDDDDDNNKGVNSDDNATVVHVVGEDGTEPATSASSSSTSTTSLSPVSLLLSRPNNEPPWCYLDVACRKLCQYYAVDPITALVSLRVYRGRPTDVRFHRAHKVPHRNCFVLALFGFPRRLAFGRERHGSHGGDTFRMSLRNNTVVAMMDDVTEQGWTYSIQNNNDDEDDDDDDDRVEGGPTPPPPNVRDETTILMFLSGKCRTAVRRRAPEPNEARGGSGENKDRRRFSVSEGAGDSRRPSRRPSRGADAWNHYQKQQKQHNHHHPHHPRPGIPSDASSSKGSVDDESSTHRLDSHPGRRFSSMSHKTPYDGDGDGDDGHGAMDPHRHGQHPHEYYAAYPQTPFPNRRHPVRAQDHDPWGKVRRPHRVDGRGPFDAAEPGGTGTKGEAKVRRVTPTTTPRSRPTSRNETMVSPPPKRRRDDEDGTGGGESDGDGDGRGGGGRSGDASVRPVWKTH